MTTSTEVEDQHDATMREPDVATASSRRRRRTRARSRRVESGRRLGSAALLAAVKVLVPSRWRSAARARQGWPRGCTSISSAPTSRPTRPLPPRPSRPPPTVPSRCCRTRRSTMDKDFSDRQVASHRRLPELLQQVHQRHRHARGQAEVGEDVGDDRAGRGLRAEARLGRSSWCS